jgi:hypothetical protein
MGHDLRSAKRVGTSVKIRQGQGIRGEKPIKSLKQGRVLLIRPSASPTLQRYVNKAK